MQAEANQGKTQLDVNRYTPLAKAKAITDQELDNAVQANLAAKADSRGGESRRIVAAKAAASRPRSSISASPGSRSPIDGIAGLAQAQVGNLVSAGSSELDDGFNCRSDQGLLHRYRAGVPRATCARTRSRASGRRANGRSSWSSCWPTAPSTRAKASSYVADREVNAQTGAIRLAGLFPNPGNILRPGQYGRVRAVTEIKRNALLVPQRAVTELQGRYQVAVVDGDNKVSIRPVKVGERSGSMWIIEDGLKPGERVVAEGTQRSGRIWSSIRSRLSRLRPGQRRSRGIEP